MNVFSEAAGSGLVWLPEIGMGRYPVPRVNRPYNSDYFARYQAMAGTKTGHLLTEARIQLVARHYDGPLVDVGIGAGQFVAARPDTFGYDVNPAGVEWLKQRDLWADLYGDQYPALTFWDSLEHIDSPEDAVAKADRWVFVSVPVFESGDHVLRSRHFKKDEHIWYWTHAGLVRWFEMQGFRLAEHNAIESTLGREDIGSYAFERMTHAR